MWSFCGRGGLHCFVFLLALNCDGLTWSALLLFRLSLFVHRSKLYVEIEEVNFIVYSRELNIITYQQHARPCIRLNFEFF